MDGYNFPIIRYQQNNQSYLCSVLPFKIIDNISKVLVYGVEDDGYQRQPNKVHYNKIKRYVLSKKDEFILPTSIILGVDEKEIQSHIQKDANGFEYLNIDPTKKIFRIVDGQHRVYGLREASKENPKILEFPLQVIIILSDESRRSIELEVFTDINSKSKRINTDLAELAKHDYQIKESRLEYEDINRHIGIKTAFYLKNEKGNNVWLNAIKFDIHSEVNLGIIGVTIFTESLSTIIDKYISEFPYQTTEKKLEGKALIDYCNDASKKVGAFLYKVWNEVIRIKWGGAFKEDIIKDDEENLVKIFFNKDYYVQKGLGIKSINPIIGEKVKELGFGEESFEAIKEIIFSSKVKIDDWKNGGTFSGYNSESGFKKIKQMILNTNTVPN